MWQFLVWIELARFFKLQANKLTKKTTQINTNKKKTTKQKKKKKNMEQKKTFFYNTTYYRNLQATPTYC